MRAVLTIDYLNHQSCAKCSRWEEKTLIKLAQYLYQALFGEIPISCTMANLTPRSAPFRAPFKVFYTFIILQ